MLDSAEFSLRYLPAEHDVILVVHDVLTLVPALNLPDAQGLHSLSLVADVARYDSPGGQDVLLVWQDVAVSVPSLYSPLSQLGHWLLLAGVSDTDSLLPAPHCVVFVEHAVDLAVPVLYLPVAQRWQRSVRCCTPALV